MMAIAKKTKAWEEERRLAIEKERLRIAAEEEMNMRMK